MSDAACGLALSWCGLCWRSSRENGPLRPEPRTGLSPTSVEHVRAASGDPTYRRGAPSLLYFAAVLLARPALARRLPSQQPWRQTVPSACVFRKVRWCFLVHIILTNLGKVPPVRVRNPLYPQCGGTTAGHRGPRRSAPVVRPPARTVAAWDQRAVHGHYWPEGCGKDRAPGAVPQEGAGGRLGRG